jgi:hypothetical protein
VITETFVMPKSCDFGFSPFFAALRCKGGLRWHQQNPHIRFWIPCIGAPMLFGPTYFSEERQLMNGKSTWMFFSLLVLGCVCRFVFASEDVNPLVEFPSDYRSWTHVKSTMVGPDHPQFDAMGGFQHIYANSIAMEGYRTRKFQEGAAIAVDWLELEQHGGGFTEGKRRRIDVMIRDKRFASTEGWGFQRFGPKGGSERIGTPSAQQCLACHTARAKDGLVLSNYKD